MTTVRYSSFRELLERVSPAWLLTAEGAAYLRALGGLQDSLVERAKDAVKARFPGYAPRDGLAAIGAERGLPRGKPDTDATYSARLQNAWDIWEWAGTATGILRALYFLGYTNCYLQSQQGATHQLDASLNVVVTTGAPLTMTAPNFWNTFVLVFPQPHIPAWVSGGIPLQTSEEGQLIINTVVAWKAAFAKLDRVIIHGTGPIWGIGTWGAPRVWGGGTAPTIWNVGL